MEYLSKDCYVATFKGLPLHTFLQSWQDTSKPGIAMHRFLKRKGGRAEDMGPEPFRTVWRLTFTGVYWRTNLIELARSIDENPIGKLVHPIWGPINVAVENLENAVNVVDALNTSSITLTFVESQLDAVIEQDEQEQETPARNQALLDDLALLADLIANVALAVIATALSAVEAAATSYSEAVDLADSGNLIDTSLSAKLDAVATTTAEAEAVILASAGTVSPGEAAPVSDATNFPYLSIINRVYGDCLALDEAMAADRPATFIYVVPSPINVTVLAAARYGARLAQTRADEILAMNPGIATPGEIPTGTSLVLPLD